MAEHESKYNIHHFDPTPVGSARSLVVSAVISPVTISLTVRRHGCINNIVVTICPMLLLFPS